VLLVGGRGGSGGRGGPVEAVGQGAAGVLGWLEGRSRTGFAGRCGWGGVIVVRARPVLAGWGGERFEALEGGGEFAGPGPGGLEAQGGGAGVEGEAGGDVQQAVAQALGLDARELAGEQQPLGPADEVVGDQHERQPHLVVLEVAGGQVLQAGVLVRCGCGPRRGRERGGDAQGRDVAGGLVGEDRRYPN